MTRCRRAASLCGVQTRPRLTSFRRRRAGTTTRLTVLVLAGRLLLSAPAAAVTVGASYRPPQLLLHFDRTETRRIGGAADTGFTLFVGSFCQAIPGGRRLLPLQMACATGLGVGYARLVPIFKAARAQRRCVRVSFPVGMPVPNPAPYSRVEACR